MIKLVVADELYYIATDSIVTTITVTKYYSFLPGHISDDKCSL